MILRPYQLEAVEFLTARRRAFLVSPAGSGKSLCGAAALAKARPEKYAWVANTKEQVDQAVDVLARVGMPAGLVCCMMARPDLSTYSHVVIDEAAHAPAAVWGSVIGTVRPEAVLWGLSATPFGDDENRNTFLKKKFEEFMFIEREEVMAGGHLVPGIVRPIDIDRPFEYDTEMRAELEAEIKRWKARYRFIADHEIRKRVQWQLTLKHLQNNAARNAAIVNIARSEMLQGESVLILVASIEHGEKLAEQIESAAMLHSKLPAKLRRQRVEDFRSGVLTCAVATSLADEGADIPRASVLLLAAGGRSATKAIQRTGRVMRPHKGKTEGVVYDFVDRGLAHAHAQWKARRRVYLELGYTLEEAVGI
jgi:superfamily II DNA or RNA helicase